MSVDPLQNRQAGSAIRVRNDLEELARLSEFVQSFFEDHALPPDPVGDCELALEEVFVNIVRYAFPAGGAHWIDINANLLNDVVTIVIEDEGVAFNPLEAELVNLDLPLEEREAGGLGLHLVKGVMDELEYAHVNGRNRMVMRKQVMS